MNWSYWDRKENELVILGQRVNGQDILGQMGGATMLPQQRVENVFFPFLIDSILIAIQPGRHTVKKLMSIRECERQNQR